MDGVGLRSIELGFRIFSRLGQFFRPGQSALDSEDIR
jgi:hypothetical protein